MWETTVPTYSWVEYGTDKENLQRARLLVDGQVICNNTLHKIRTETRAEILLPRMLHRNLVVQGIQ